MSLKLESTCAATTVLPTHFVLSEEKYILFIFITKKRKDGEGVKRGAGEKMGIRRRGNTKKKIVTRDFHTRCLVKGGLRMKR